VEDSAIFYFMRAKNFLEDPFVVFRVWQGGMASHGGFLGIIFVAAWFARTRKVSFLRIGRFNVCFSSCRIIFWSPG
jgi:phosphatidylglycerol:prolipoprotein diacylglycerol transferase